MNIDDLIQPNTVKRVTPKHDSFWGARNKRLSSQKLGSGLFSTVIPSKTGHSVYKIPNRAKSNYGFDAVASYILKFQDVNPFLPRIFKVKVKKTSEGKEIFDYEMEHLLRADQVNQEMLSDYLDTLIDFKKAVVLGYYSWSELSTPVQKLKRAAEFICEEKFIKNRMLKNTIDSIKDWVGSGVLDRNPNNFMFRMGKLGLQLVLADPFLTFVEDDENED